MPYAVADDLLRSGKYRNYHQRVESGERNPAAPDNASRREMVGARLFPSYQANIQYAALSPDGRGLGSYGSIAVGWDVTPYYLGQRAVLIEENSYVFFERHGLGNPETAIPSGFRAIWEDRVMLATAKHGEQLTTSTPDEELAKLLLHSADDRSDDEFIEILIYTDKGLDTLDVTTVTVQKSPKDDDERHRLEILRDLCVKNDVSFVE